MSLIMTIPDKNTELRHKSNIYNVNISTYWYTFITCLFVYGIYLKLTTQNFDGRCYISVLIWLKSKSTRPIDIKDEPTGIR